MSDAESCSAMHTVTLGLAFVRDSHTTVRTMTLFAC